MPIVWKQGIFGTGGSSRGGHTIGIVPNTRYAFGTIPTSINEGASGTFNFNTTLVNNGTTLYWTINHITTADADFSAVNGSFTVTSNTGSFSISPVADVTTEGAETFTVSIRTGSTSGSVIAVSDLITINDTSLAPVLTYAFGSIPTSINEGASGTFNVNTTNVSNGTTLYWTINNTTTADADFSTVSGSFTITGNAGSFSISPVADVTTEGAETFTVSIRTGSTSGSVVATSNSVTINDTSLAPVYDVGAIPTSINEGSSGTFNVITANVSNGTTLYWTINHITTADADFSAVSGSFTITGNAGSFSISPVADVTTEGAETFTVSIRTVSTSGPIQYTTALVTVNDTSVPTATGKAIFGYGWTGPYQSMTNLVSTAGVVATDTTGVGTVRYNLAAASYGVDKGIFGYGGTGSTTFYSMTNLISNAGVVATDTTGVGTARQELAAATYGGDKAIFGFGYTGGYTGITNLVSNAGVVATNTTGVGTGRSGAAAATYGGDKAIFGYGINGVGANDLSITNLVSNAGVVASNTTGVGTARYSLAAAGYGGDKAIFGYGFNSGSGMQSITNLVSNAGVVATNTTGVGSVRNYLAAATYGTDKAIFGYGGDGTIFHATTNRVSNAGVVATNTTGVGTARQGLAATGF